MAKKEGKTIKHQKIGIPAFNTKHEFDIFEIGVMMGADATMESIKLTINAIVDSIEKIKEDLPDDNK